MLGKLKNDGLSHKETFLEKATQGNLVPVWREVIADHETAVSAYERVRTFLRNRIRFRIAIY